jgi:hypothetical protein
LSEYTNIYSKDINALTHKMMREAGIDYRNIGPHAVSEPNMHTSALIHLSGCSFIHRTVSRPYAVNCYALVFDDNAKAMAFYIKWSDDLMTHSDLLAEERKLHSW